MEGDELEYGLVNSENRLFIADEERLDRVRDILPDLSKGLRSRNVKPEYVEINFDQIIDDADTELQKIVDIDPEDEASIMYTSGSTGHQGVVLTHRGIIFAPLYWITITTMGRLAETGEDASSDDQLVEDKHQPANTKRSSFSRHWMSAIFSYRLLWEEKQ